MKPSTLFAVTAALGAFSPVYKRSSRESEPMSLYLNPSVRAKVEAQRIENAKKRDERKAKKKQREASRRKNR